MGDTDADQVKLHFEIRRLGKPIDPAKFLPPG
jgi:lipoprotein NlpD